MTSILGSLLQTWTRSNSNVLKQTCLGEAQKCCTGRWAQTQPASCPAASPDPAKLPASSQLLQQTSSGGRGHLIAAPAGCFAPLPGHSRPPGLCSAVPGSWCLLRLPCPAGWPQRPAEWTEEPARHQSPPLAGRPHTGSRVLQCKMQVVAVRLQPLVTGYRCGSVYA